MDAYTTEKICHNKNATNLICSQSCANKTKNNVHSMAVTFSHCADVPQARVNCVNYWQGHW